MSIATTALPVVTSIAGSDDIIVNASGATSRITRTNAGTSLGIPAAANPTGTVGLAAVNGSASTFLRSDGAPALSQAIIPTWTGQHAFAQGTITTSAPHTLTQTWNAAGVTFTGLLLNITATAKAAASLIYDIQIGSVSKQAMDVNGSIVSNPTNASGPGSSTEFMVRNNANAGIGSSSGGFGNEALTTFSRNKAVALWYYDGASSYIYNTRSDAMIGWASAANPSFSQDTAFSRLTAGVAQINTGTAGTGGAIHYPETASDADPAAPSTGGIVYSKKVGGKNALFVRFPTGSAIQLAIEV